MGEILSELADLITSLNTNLLFTPSTFTPLIPVVLTKRNNFCKLLLLLKLYNHEQKALQWFFFFFHTCYRFHSCISVPQTGGLASHNYAYYFSVSSSCYEIISLPAATLQSITWNVAQDRNALAEALCKLLTRQPLLMKSPVKDILHVLTEKPSSTSLCCQSRRFFSTAPNNATFYFSIFAFLKKDKKNFHFCDSWNTSVWFALVLLFRSARQHDHTVFTRKILFIKTQKDHSPVMSSTLLFISDSRRSLCL